MSVTELLARPGVRWVVGVCLLSAFYLGAGVFDHEVWAPTEPTMGGVVWEMFRYGDLLVPHINGLAYLEKPPLAYVLSWLGFELYGEPSAGLLRLPSALAGIGCVMTVFAAAGRFYDEPTAWLCALLCALTANFWSIAHRAGTDAPVMFCIFLALALFMRTLPPDAGGSGATSGLAATPAWRRDAGWCLTLAVSFLIKNFFAYLFVVPPIVLLLLSQRDYRRLAICAAWLAGTWLLVAGPWCAAVYAAGGEDYLRVVFFDNTLGRFAAIPAPPEAVLNPLNDAFFVHKNNGPALTLTAVPAQMLPWILIQPLALWSFIKRKPRAEWRKFLLVALYCSVFLLTLSASRTESYFRPLAFCLCLIAGDFLHRAYDPANGNARRDRTLVIASWLLVALALTGLPIVTARVTDTPWLNEVAALDALCCIAAIAASRKRWSQRPTALAWGLGCAAMAAVTLAALMQPIDRFRSQRPFFLEVAQKLDDRDELATTEVNDRALPIMNYYLDRRLEPVDANEVPMRLASDAGFAVIMSRVRFDSLAAALANPRYRIVHSPNGADKFVYIDNGPCRYRTSRAPTTLTGRADRTSRTDRTRRGTRGTLNRRCA